MNIRRLGSSPQIPIIVILTLIYWCGANSIAPFMSLFVKDINLTILQTSFFLGGVAITRIIIQPIIGLFIGKINENHAMTMALLLLALSSLSYALFKNFYVLLGFRLVEGIAMGSFMIASRILINNFSYNEISVINNYSSGMKNLGTFMGPALAGLLIESMGIKSIFFVSCFIFVIGFYLATKIQPLNSKQIDGTEDLSDTQKIPKRVPYLFFIMLLHSIEFIGLGLWLAGWPVYANSELNWSSGKIGFSFSIMAISGGAIVYLIGNKFKAFSKLKIIIGLTLLAIPPILVIHAKNNELLIWVGLSLGGIGATIYFANFHTYISTLLRKKEVPIFYGLIGTFTFAGQAIGLALTPILWANFSYGIPIIVDYILLILDSCLYLLFFYVPYLYKQVVN